MTLIPTLPRGPAQEMAPLVTWLSKSSELQPMHQTLSALSANYVPPSSQPSRPRHPAEATVTSRITPAPLPASPLHLCPPRTHRPHATWRRLLKSRHALLKTLPHHGHTWDTISNPVARASGSILSPPPPTPSCPLSVPSTHRPRRCCAHRRHALPKTPHTACSPDPFKPRFKPHA